MERNGGDEHGVEGSLLEPQHRLASILEATSDLVAIALPDTTVVYMNAAGKKLLGWDQDAAPSGKTIANAHPKWASDIIEKQGLPQAVQNGDWEGETALLCADGTEIPVSQVIVSHKNAAGGVEYLSTIMRDITAQKQAEKRLLASEANYRTIFDAGHDAIVVHDMETGAILDVNRRMCEMFGYTRDEVLNLDVGAISLGSHPYTKVEAEKKIQKATTQGPQNFEWICRKKGGEPFWAEVTLKRVTIAGQERILATDRDITERKKAEEERKDLERQVQHAQKLECLGVLAGGIAHDFNNLLMAILGNANLAQAVLTPSSPAFKSVKEIEQAAKQAANLAGQMLAYTGKGRFVVEQIDLNSFVREMTHLLEVSISKKATLKYNLAENLPTFAGDVNQIRQIIMNLIINASEALGSHSGTITLTTREAFCAPTKLDQVHPVGLIAPLPKGTYIHLEVTDTGCGMDAETLEKVFDPFFSTKFAGRGLGMAAVLGIVRGHEGAIHVRSKVGKGTTFEVLLPAGEAADKLPVVEAKESTDGAPLGRGTVLVADDEKMVRTVSRKMLEHMGFRVLTAHDGGKALEVFRKHSAEIVCVLLDLTMPVMDGSEVFLAMQRLVPDVPVILCSGFNEQDATQRLTGAGLAGFLQKPYSIGMLREKLRVMLEPAPSDPPKTE